MTNMFMFCNSIKEAKRMIDEIEEYKKTEIMSGQEPTLDGFLSFIQKQCISVQDTELEIARVEIRRLEQKLGE